MNSYTVEWNDDALDQLAVEWMQAPDPRAVNAAQTTIDRLLSRDPLGHGVEVSEGLRRLTVPPLSVQYTVDEERREVEVCSVRRPP